MRYVAHPDKRIALAIPELLDELRDAARPPAGLDERRVPVRALGRRAPLVHREHIFRDPAGASATPTARCASAREDADAPRA